MHQLPSKTVFPYLLIPQQLDDYEFDYNTDKKERIILSFMVLRSFPKIREQKELFNIVKKYTGSRYAQYLDIIMKTGINPLLDEPFDVCVPYYFTSPSVADAVNDLLEHL